MKKLAIIFASIILVCGIGFSIFFAVKCSSVDVNQPQIEEEDKTENNPNEQDPNNQDHNNTPENDNNEQNNDNNEQNGDQNNQTDESQQDIQTPEIICEESITIDILENKKIEYQIKYCAQGTVTISTTNSEIAEINEQGYIIPNKVGLTTAIINLNYNNKNISKNIEINITNNNVKILTKINNNLSELNNINLYLFNEEYLTEANNDNIANKIEFNYYLSNNINKNISINFEENYYLNYIDYENLNNTIKITAKSAGRVTLNIICEDLNLNKQIIINIQNILPQSITFNGENYEINNNNQIDININKNQGYDFNYYKNPIYALGEISVISENSAINNNKISFANAGDYVAQIILNSQVVLTINYHVLPLEEDVYKFYFKINGEDFAGSEFITNLDEVNFVIYIADENNLEFYNQEFDYEILNDEIVEHELNLKSFYFVFLQKGSITINLWSKTNSDICTTIIITYE